MGNQNQNANRSNFFLKTYSNWRYFIIVKNRPTVNTGSLPFGFFFRLVVFTCNRVCQIFTSSEEPAMLLVREPRCSIHEL